MKEDIVPEVLTIIAEQLMVKEEQVVPGADLAGDLGADSLDAVELAIKFEEKFNISIPDCDAEKCVTVQNWYDLIEKLIRQKED